MDMKKLDEEFENEIICEFSKSEDMNWKKILKKIHNRDRKLLDMVVGEIKTLIEEQKKINIDYVEGVEYGKWKGERRAYKKAVEVIEKIKEGV